MSGADKILDLDALRPPARKIKIGGRELALSQRTFGGLRRFRDASKAASDATADAQEAAVLALLRVVIPGADQEIADLLDPEGELLSALLRHWSGQDADEAAEVAQDPPPPG